MMTQPRRFLTVVSNRLRGPDGDEYRGPTRMAPPSRVPTPPDWTRWGGRTPGGDRETSVLRGTTDGVTTQGHGRPT